MALFKKTYQDNLRALKKEQDINAANATVSELIVDPFKSYITDISNNEMEPIEQVFLFKKNLAKINYAYTLPIPIEAKFTNRNGNVYELTEAFLPSILPDCKSVDSDFLTGYYLAKFHLDLPQLMTSFHAGISKDSLIQGIYHAMLKLRPKAKWQMFGCDANKNKKYQNILKNGVRIPCDIYNSNTVNSINIQLSEVISNKSIDLYTCDIKSNSAADVLKQLLMIREYLNDSVRIVLRLPTNWHTYYTAMQTILWFCISHFKSVKIFKTPWGAVPKYYLILKDFKETINLQKATAINTYLQALNENQNTPLISKTYLDDEDQKIIIENINKAYINMISFDIKYTADEALQLYTSIL
jgi:viroplasmin and RNaseH domain-containing protein